MKKEMILQITAIELINFAVSPEYKEKYLFRVPPLEVSIALGNHISYGDAVSAIYHPKHGWFIVSFKPGKALEQSEIISWWKKEGIAQ